eukprot:13867936-Heterocapsa_arctica.AAC.1
MCTPWCPVQNCKLKHSHQPAGRRIESERSDSIHIIGVRGKLIGQNMTDDAVQPYIEFDFKWPRRCAGWQLDMLDENASS